MNKPFLIIALSLSLSGCTLLNQQKPVNNKLDLSNHQLQKVPSYVFKQTNLEELDISNNHITGAIQAEIRNLKNLRVLKASDNMMTGVPAEIGQLSNLQIFDLNHNFISGVPAEIGHLQNLQMLDLSNNEITGLPYELGSLKNLQIFNISGNSYLVPDSNTIVSKLPSSTKIIK